MYQPINPNFELSVFFVGMFNDTTNNWFPHIIDSTVSKKVMLSVYESMVKDLSIPSIEALSKEEKKMLVQHCRDTGLKFNNKRLIECAKIIHTIKLINQHS